MIKLSVSLSKAFNFYHVYHSYSDILIYIHILIESVLKLIINPLINMPL